MPAGITISDGVCSGAVYVDACGRASIQRECYGEQRFIAALNGAMAVAVVIAWCQEPGRRGERGL
jgi:hypothetical protein